jgi:predicted acylesterase/phospholipase RssA
MLLLDAAKAAKYLCLSGGGQRGIAYVGALRALARHGVDYGARSPRLQGAAGTSIGAYVATLVAAGYTASELEEEAFRTSPDTFFSLNLGLLFTQYGLDDGARLMSHINALLKRKLGLARITLPEFRLKTGVDLVVVATEVRTNEARYLRADTVPHMTVAEAVAASMAVPPIYAPYKHGADLLVDGGFVENFPVSVFPSDGVFGMRVNWKCAFRMNEMDQYFSRLAYCALASSEEAQWLKLPEATRARVLNIDVGDVSTIDLRVTDAEKRLMLLRGDCAAMEALSHAAASAPTTTTVASAPPTTTLASTSSTLAWAPSTHAAPPDALVKS